MPDVRFQGMAKFESNINVFFKDNFGIELVKDGEDWVISGNDPFLLDGSPDVFQMHPAVDFISTDPAITAINLASLIPETMEEFQPGEPFDIQLLEGMGDLTEIERISAFLVGEDKSKVEEIIEKEVLPFMAKQNMKMVIPITIDSKFQMTWFSVLKIGLLTEKFGFDEARSRVQENRALEGILPSSLDILSYLDALTRLAPIAISFPIRRWDASFHFVGGGFLSFPSVGPINGYFSEFFSSLAPMDAEPVGPHTLKLKGMNYEGIWKYFKAIVASLNGFLKFLNNPTFFLDDDGKSINLLKQLQIHCGVYLLYSDLLAMNYSTNNYLRNHLCFSILDRLANMKANFSGEMGTDTDNFSRLISAKFGVFLSEIFDREFAPYSGELATAWKDMTTDCYQEFHEHLEKEIGENGSSEENRLERVRAERNLVGHGTFLRRSQFESLFFESQGMMPPQLPIMAFLLVLGLTLSPKEFLEF
jgi:hypothetical protein